MKKKVLEPSQCGVVWKREAILTCKEKKRRNLMAVLLDIVLFFLVAYSAMYCFISGYGIDCNERLFTGAVAALVVAFYVSFSVKKGVEGLLFLEILLYSIWSYQKREEISGGLAITLNNVLSKAANYFGYKFNKYKEPAGNKEAQVTVFLFFLSVLFVGVVVYLMKNQIATLLLLLLTLFLVFSPEYVGLVPGMKAYAGYALGMLGFIGSKKVEKRRSKMKSCTEKSIQGKIRLLQLFAGVVCLVVVFFTIPESRYAQITEKQSFREAVQKMVRDNFNQFVKGQLYSGSVSGGIGFGELGRAEEVNYRKDVKLKLSADESNLENLGQIYLRGYIGSVYENNGWSGLKGQEQKKKEQLEKKSDIALEDYASAVYYYILSQQQLSEDTSFLSSGEKEKMEKEESFLQSYRYDNAMNLMENTSSWLLQEVEVENIGESFGTVFIPYGAMGPVSEKNGKLSAKNIKNKEKYSWQRSQLLWYYMPFNEGMLKMETEEEDDLLQEWEEDGDVDPRWENEGDLFHESAIWNKGASDGENPVEQFWESLLESKEDVEREFGISVMDADADELKGKVWEEQDASSYVKMLQNAIKFYAQQQDYEKFAEDVYTQISKEQKEKLLAQIDGYETYDGDWATIKKDIGLIRKYLQENTKYTLSPGKTPEGKDFVEYFLFGNKKGYCSHYASAATLMLRAMGIPARYVEGYVAKSTKLDNGARYNGKVSVNLTDENAHAWVEIYFKGYGWVPVEMTSGYGTNEQEEATPEPDETAKETKAPKETTPPLAQDTLEMEQTPEPVTVSETSGFDWTRCVLVLKAAGCVFLLCFVVIGRRQLILFSRKRKEENPDFAVRMAYYYQRIERLLLSRKQRRKGRSLSDDIETGRVADCGVDEAQWQELLVRMNKYAFSEHGVSREDIEWISDLYQNVLGNIYKNKSILWKIYYKYIKVL